MKKNFAVLIMIFSMIAGTFLSAEKHTMKINSGLRSKEKIDNVCFFCALYTGKNTKIMWPEYYVDVERQTKIHFNNPYLVNPNDGVMDQIVYIVANGKYYVGSYSILANSNNSYVLAAFEFDDYQKAKEVLFLWSYLKLLQSRDCTELHFVPDAPEFWWDDEDSFCLEIPKDMIEDNYQIYKSKGYKNAFSDEQLLIDGQWFDLSDGKQCSYRQKKYSSNNGKLFCNGKQINLENDINKMIRVSVYHNSEKFYELLKSGPGYYYCQRCANNPYGSGLRPIEFYGYHYQDIVSKEFWKEKAGAWRPVFWQLDDSIKCTKD